MHMKKVIMILACLVMSASIYAQDITGKWFQTNSTVEEGTEVNYVDTLTLARNNSFSDVVMVEMKMDDGNGKQIAIKLAICCAGTWSCEKGVLTRTYDPKSVRAEILEPAGLPKVLSSMITKKAVSEFRKQTKEPQHSKILELTADELSIQSGDAEENREYYIR